MIRLMNWILVSIATTSLFATFELKPVYINKEITSGVVNIDGSLEEVVWQDASVVADFVEVYPDDRGRSAPLATEIKVFYNEHGMFVGFWFETPVDKQLSRLSFRDNQGVERDWFRISIDPTGQGVNGYYMELALGGSKRDGTIVDERKQRSEWDGPWMGATRSFEDGWSGEMFLPWSMFALPNVENPERQMGIHFERWVAHLAERWAWEPLSDRDPRYLSGFSRLKIRNVESPGSLIIYPYASGARDQMAGSTQGRGGLDLFWTPTDGLRLAATALPDFGQVESDSLVVNLDAVETFFPEKRPFFMEDRDIYNTRKYNLVHTRRIGSAPDLPELGEGHYAQEIDGASDILVASKVTGQVGNYRYGGMLAVEDDSRFTMVNQETGETERQSISGRRFYTGRVMHEKISDSGAFNSFGWLGTFVDRTSIDRQAQVHALDYNYRSADGKLNVAWQGMSSIISDKRPEREDTNGFGSWVDATWRPSRNWSFWGEVVMLDDKLDINDLGFLWRNNQRWVGTMGRYSKTDHPKFRELRTSMSLSRGENTDGRLINADLWAEQFFGFQNRTSIRLATYTKTEKWDDLISRGNGIVRVPGYTHAVIGWDSDSRKKVGGYAEIRMMDNGWGGGFNAWETFFNARFTINEHLDLRLTGRYQETEDWLLWRGGTNFATYSGTQFSPTFRTNVLFSPKQDLRLVLQWYAIEAKATRSLAMTEDGQLFETDENTVQNDFAIGSMAFQVRYRYEIAPLSDLYVVYSRGGNFSDNQSAQLGDIWSNTVDNKTADNFMLKFRYRFD